MVAGRARGHGGARGSIGCRGARSRHVFFGSARGLRRGTERRSGHAARNQAPGTSQRGHGARPRRCTWPTVLVMAARAAPAASGRTRESSIGRPMAPWLRAMVGLAVGAVAALLAPGFLLDSPQPAPRASDAIVVISGDEQMARLQAGENLYE